MLPTSASMATSIQIGIKSDFHQMKVARSSNRRWPEKTIKKIFVHQLALLESNHGWVSTSELSRPSAFQTLLHHAQHCEQPMFCIASWFEYAHLVQAATSQVWPNP
jgi:hypothetical protein